MHQGMPAPGPFEPNISNAFSIPFTRDTSFDIDIYQMEVIKFGLVCIVNMGTNLDLVQSHCFHR